MPPQPRSSRAALEQAVPIRWDAGPCTLGSLGSVPAPCMAGRVVCAAGSTQAVPGLGRGTGYPSSAWVKATERVESVGWPYVCLSHLGCVVQPGISSPAEGHEVEAFSKNSCDALGAEGQSCPWLQQGGQDSQGAGGRKEKGSSRGTGHKGKSPFSRKRLLQLSVTLAARYPGENAWCSAPRRQICGSTHCTGPCTVLWKPHACSMQMARPVVIWV